LAKWPAFLQHQLILFLCAFCRDLIISIAMNLLSLPDGRIINLEHLTYAERAGEYLALHFDSGAEGGIGSVVRLKQGEGARRVWAYRAGKCTGKIEPVQ
jgi:hypothetical protein